MISDMRQPLPCTGCINTIRQPLSYIVSFPFRSVMSQDARRSMIDGPHHGNALIDGPIDDTGNATTHTLSQQDVV